MSERHSTESIDNALRDDYRRYRESVPVPPAPAVRPAHTPWPRRIQPRSIDRLVCGLAVAMVLLFTPAAFAQRDSRPAMGLLIARFALDPHAHEAGRMISETFVEGIRRQFAAETERSTQ